MPFSGTWFYADVLFIVDPWIWAVLVAGIVLSARRWRAGAAGAAGRPAQAALGVMLGYILAVALSGVIGERIVRSNLPLADAGVTRIMMSPVPVNPFRRYVLLDQGDRYHVGTFNFLMRPTVRFDDFSEIAKGDRHPAAVAAAGTPEGRAFLSWARFPFFEVESAAESWRVHIIDARYTLESGVSFGSLTVEVPR